MVLRRQSLAGAVHSLAAAPGSSSSSCAGTPRTLAEVEHINIFIRIHLPFTFLSDIYGPMVLILDGN